VYCQNVFKDEEAYNLLKV